MWEFMKTYADAFWNASETALEIFSVIMAWSITLGLALFMIANIWAIGAIVADNIRERIKGNGKK